MKRAKFMKKKKYIIIFAVMIAIAAVGALMIISTKLDTAFLRKPSQAYENVYIIDGNNGNSVKVLDKEKEELFEKLKNLEWTRDFFHKQLTEWLYHIQFTMEGELYIITIVDDNCIAVNENKFYKVETERLIDFIRERLQVRLI